VKFNTVAWTELNEFTKRDGIHCNENPIYVYPEKELRGLSAIYFPAAE
jgi:hypothetical protein